MVLPGGLHIRLVSFLGSHRPFLLDFWELPKTRGDRERGEQGGDEYNWN